MKHSETHSSAKPQTVKFLIWVGASVLLCAGGISVAKAWKRSMVVAHAAEFAGANRLSGEELAARLRKNNGDPVAHYALADKAASQKDYGKAIDECKLALLREPENPQISMAMALYLHFAHRDNEAKEYCEKVIATKDENFAPTAQKLLTKLNNPR